MEAGRQWDSHRAVQVEFSLVQDSCIRAACGWGIPKNALAISLCNPLLHMLHSSEILSFCISTLYFYVFLKSQFCRYIPNLFSRSLILILDSPLPLISWFHPRLWLSFIMIADTIHLRRVYQAHIKGLIPFLPASRTTTGVQEPECWGQIGKKSWFLVDEFGFCPVMSLQRSVV